MGILFIVYIKKINRAILKGLFRKLHWFHSLVRMQIIDLLPSIKLVLLWFAHVRTAPKCVAFPNLLMEEVFKTITDIEPCMETAWLCLLFQLDVKACSLYVTPFVNGFIQRKNKTLLGVRKIWIKTVFEAIIWQRILKSNLGETFHNYLIISLRRGTFPHYHSQTHTRTLRYIERDR